MFRMLCLALAGAAASTLSWPSASTAQSRPQAAEAAVPTRFSVVVEGKGPDLILIPGLMSGREIWDDSVASLGGRYRVHRLKLSGFAGEPARGNADGPILDNVVEQLDAYIKTNRLVRPAIAGHSMGGLTAMLLAARHPDLVGRILVVDALPFYSLLFGPDSTVQAVTPRAAAFRDQVLAMDEAAWRAGQPRTAATMVKTEAFRLRLIADAEASDRAVAAKAIYEAMTTDARTLLPSIKAPLTIAYATNEFAGEEMMGPLYRNAYSSARGARLVRIDGSYHFIMYDQPERFRALLAEFLAGD